MGILGSLYSGVSGLNINGNAMSVISNNISNNNTLGFKSGRTLFSDLLSASVAGSGGANQVGRGAGLATVDNIFSQGTFVNSEINSDLAVEGDGFFIVEDPVMNIQYYTRAGAFRFDDDGILISPEGNRVQGYAVNDSGNIAGDLVDVAVNTGSLSEPVATTEMSLATNLDASATAPTGGFDINDLANTVNYSNSMNVYDSLGVAHLVTLHFTKTAANSWDYNATVEGEEVGQAAGPYVVSTGTISFDNAGLMTSAVSTSPASATPTTNALAWVNGSDATQTLTIDFQTTQYSSPSIVVAKSQDGVSTGSISNISIDNEGYVSGKFSNGQPKKLYKIALAKFSNPAGLEKVGNSNFRQTGNSGVPVVGTVGTGVGKIFTNALEQSNVDLAAEFVSMITTQRGFQASSKVITTTDEMLSDLINLKR